MGINNANFTGNIVSDADLSMTASGLCVSNFTVAVNKYRKDSEPTVSYLDCVLFGDRAHSLTPHLTKGTKVAVNAEIKQERWEKDGKKNSRIRFIVGGLEFLSSKEFSDSKPATPAQTDSSVYDDDIPF